MRPVRRPKTRQERRARRHVRVRKKVSGSAERPRLVVFRSLKHIDAQLVDDDRGVTLVAVSDRTKDFVHDGKGKIGAAMRVGTVLAKRAGEQGIKRIIFDRSGYPFHGRVKAVAEGARKGGLEF